MGMVQWRPLIRANACCRRPGAVRFWRAVVLGLAADQSRGGAVMITAHVTQYRIGRSLEMTGEQ